MKLLLAAAALFWSQLLSAAVGRDVIVPTVGMPYDVHVVMTDERAVVTWWTLGGAFSAAVALNGAVTPPTMIDPAPVVPSVASNGRDLMAAWALRPPAGSNIVFAPLDAFGRPRGEPTVLATEREVSRVMVAAAGEHFLAAWFRDSYDPAILNWVVLDRYGHPTSAIHTYTAQSFEYSYEFPVTGSEDRFAITMRSPYQLSTAISTLLITSDGEPASDPIMVGEGPRAVTSVQNGDFLVAWQGYFDRFISMRTVGRDGTLGPVSRVSLQDQTASFGAGDIAWTGFARILGFTTTCVFPCGVNLFWHTWLLRDDTPVSVPLGDIDCKSCDRFTLAAQEGMVAVAYSRNGREIVIRLIDLQPPRARAVRH